MAVSPAMRRPRLLPHGRLLGWLLGLATCATLAPTARSEEPPPTERTAKAALEAGKADARSKDAPTRARAARTLGATDHPLVARDLLGRLRREPEPSVQAAILEALGAQRASREDVGKRVVAWLGERAEALVRRVRSGDPGFPVDPRTGEPALHTVQGREALARSEAEGAAVAAALRLFEAFGADVAKAAPTWVPFLQEPVDAVVVETLRALARARCLEALPAILDLYRMYPTAATWETGAVVDLAGDNASARRAWIVSFGHPEKQRSRPQVHRAIVEAVLAITGQRLEGPEGLAAWLKGGSPQARSTGASR